MKKIIILISILSLTLTGCINSLPGKDSAEQTVSIRNFEECIQSGGLVIESYPRKCMTEDKILFIEQISQIETMSVTLYFANKQKDPQMLDCTKVYPVKRTVRKSGDLPRASLWELLQGPTEDEEKEGYVTFLNDQIGVRSISIEDRKVKVDFDSEFNREVGGSCRVQGINAQLKETLTQFDNIDEMEISVNGQTEGILEP